jgi:uncharacterized membrane protein
VIIAMWVINGLLAVVFVAAGAVKIVTPAEALRARGMTWVEEYKPATVRVIGAAEVLGAVGLIVPRLISIAPILTPIAALCLAATMAGAVATHVRRQEPYAPALVLGAACLASALLGFVAH